MHRDFEFLAGNSNKYIRILVCLAVVALIAGCATTKAPKQTVFVPVYSDSDCQAAVRAGAQAMADFSAEKGLAKIENRAPNYLKARADLEGALARLGPGKVSPVKPEYERAAVYFQAALEGMHRIVIGQEGGDETAEAVGWEIFERSAGELLLVLEPYASAGLKGPVQRP